MIDAWKKYSDKITSMGSSYKDQDVESKLLPCLTFCPWTAFKEEGFYFDNDMFLRNSFEKEELFSNVTQFSNKSLFLFQEIKGIFIGRCYMLCYLKEVIEMDRIYFGLMKKTGITGENCQMF
jgi:hypothetical protein